MLLNMLVTSISISLRDATQHVSHKYQHNQSMRCYSTC